MTNPYFGLLPQQPPQIQRGANQMPMQMPTLYSGLGMGGMQMPAPTAPAQPTAPGASGPAPQGMGSVLSGLAQQGGFGAIGQPTPGGAAGYGQPGYQPGSNLIAQLLKKAYTTPGDEWNTQTVPAGSMQGWLNNIFMR